MLFTFSYFAVDAVSAAAAAVNGNAVVVLDDMDENLHLCDELYALVADADAISRVVASIHTARSEQRRKLETETLETEESWCVRAVRNAREHEELRSRAAITDIKRFISTARAHHIIESQTQ